MSRLRVLARLAVLLVLCALATGARAQSRGFTLNRYEPTHPGEFSFLIDRPYYSSTRFFAVGLTLNYAHDPLVLGVATIDSDFQTPSPVIQHQLLGHVDIAGSFLDHVTIGLSLPITLIETGRALAGVTPSGGGSFGDPRLSVLARVFNHADQHAFSLHLGLSAWLPLRAFTDGPPPQSSDSGPRFLPRVVGAGSVRRVRWSASLGFLYRPTATLGAAPSDQGSRAGSEVQLGVAAGYHGVLRGSPYQLGPELLLATDVANGRAFRSDQSRLELLLGGHLHLNQQVLFGLAAGPGFLRAPGTPDVRVLVRVAYAPVRKPPAPACLPESPAPDRDRDGVLDRDDICPVIPKGDTPDPERHGCPLTDRDQDRIPDRDDLCPTTPAGPTPDPERVGCPLGDRDQDRIPDRDDLCPTIPVGPTPDSARPGCPQIDSDRDGVFDATDLCPLVPAGISPDPQRAGCPLPDRDQDSVPDRSDACPDAPGAPHPDPKKNGCPGMVEVQGSQLLINQPVFFATDEDTILPQSFPVLQAVADALVAKPEIRLLSIDGHTDDRGTDEHNRDLSQRRAASVRRFLSDHGVAEARLTAQGFGASQPLSDNATPEGRALNRRVEFIIKDPPQPERARVRPALTPPPEIIDRAPKKRGARKRRSTGDKP